MSKYDRSYIMMRAHELKRSGKSWQDALRISWKEEKTRVNFPLKVEVFAKQRRAKIKVQNAEWLSSQFLPMRAGQGIEIPTLIDA